jgi:hypothetical protein
MAWGKNMDLRESVAVQRWMREGEEKGIKRGVKKGRLKTRRADLLSVLSARFGKVGKRLEARILRIKDAALLGKLIKRAVVARSMDRLLGRSHRASAKRSPTPRPSPRAGRSR